MAVIGEAQPIHDAPSEHQDKLDEGALHFWDAIVMAVAGSAPAYSIAATTALLVGTVGFAGPAALLWCGIPMFGIAMAYHQLNKMGASAGAAYAWVGRVLHPYLGWLTGWCLVVSALIFMVAGSFPAGQVTLSLFSATAGSHAGWVALVGSIWFLVMAYFVARGVRITANAQWLMSSIECGLLVIFVILGFIHASGHPHISFSLSWLGFGHFTGFTGSGASFVAGALIAAFYYWGWDVSSNLGEETENSEKNSGAGGLIGVAICFVLFELFTIVINMDIPAKQIGSSTNVLQNLGHVVGGGVGGKLMIVAVALSTIATLETTLIQVTRSLWSMAREKTLPARFGVLHHEWRTPAYATAVVVLISLCLFIVSSLAGSVYTVLQDAISAIGLQIAVYYSLAGFAAVVAFRKLAFKSLSNLVLMFLFPLAGGAFMLFVFIESLTSGSLTGTEIWLGIGAIMIGVIPLGYYGYKGSPYLREKPTLGRVLPAEEFVGAERIA
ncbi:MAG TPA: APC family permease [Solirubrobacteraceae bacterium]|nr:APC family permease [Solirubrobacteraceae bacterium]